MDQMNNYWVGFNNVKCMLILTLYILEYGLYLIFDLDSDSNANMCLVSEWVCFFLVVLVLYPILFVILIAMRLTHSLFLLLLNK